MKIIVVALSKQTILNTKPSIYPTSATSKF